MFNLQEVKLSTATEKMSMKYGKGKSQEAYDWLPE